ncbi:MAG: ABC transporter substrate-binding protein [Burkholderiales bacterium]|nr:MAG: ABC transporter substrate-binding protein [Betaproteobacteria bacterium]TAG24173.1 MAG: ABC transporter substrate-binding protein [Burkholderiales bacterium]TAG48116.1 MAG: ABC transporter substrate-binding protein [Betaproteobacteria bacterium]
MRPLKTLAIAVAVATAATVTQAQIKIGFVAELSGPQAPLGQDQYDALMLLVEQNGGKLGGQAVQIIKEDSQLKPDVANQVVDKLLEKDKVQIITGVTFSNIMMAVHKKITDKGVFLIGSNAGPSPIAGAQCSPYFFSTSWQNDMQAEVVGKYASDKGYKSVMAMAPNYQAGKDFVAGFKRTYKGGTVVDEIYTPLNQQDFSAELAQVASKKPDALYVFYPGGLGVNFVKQFQQAGLNKSMTVMSASTVDGTTLPALRDAALGMLSGTFWGPDFPNEANQKFVAAFEKKYNRIPSQYAAQSYDAAQLLDSAIRKVSGKVDNKKAFHAALKAADFKSVRGNFKFGANQFPVQDMFMFDVAKDSKGRVSLRTVSKPLVGHTDSYVGQCQMKTL